MLGVGYETTDADVRARVRRADQALSPRSVRALQSPKLRQIAAEIFILIRDAYRRLADESGRQQVLATLGAMPTRAQTQPRAQPRVAARRRRAPSRLAARRRCRPPRRDRRRSRAADPRRAARRADEPEREAAELAHTELATRRADLAIPVEPPAAESRRRRATAAGRDAAARTTRASRSRATPPPVGEPVDTSALEALIDDGKLDEALAAYRAAREEAPAGSRRCRAGIELCEGLKALAARDRLEAAQRFEAALELDPSNERAARELADMRRQATNERKGLLSRLMGKKEPPP